MPAAPSSQIALPARYRVLRHIANGGMAAVCAAADELLGRAVAIKVLAAALAADDSRRASASRARPEPPRASATTPTS